MLARIEEAFARARGGGVIVRRSAGGYSLSSARTGGRIARLRPTGDGDKVEVALGFDRHVPHRRIGIRERECAERTKVDRRAQHGHQSAR